MNDYLLLFTITPVQAFISQARKTHDLWAGSRILSELIEVARTKVVNDYRAEIVFPINNADYNDDESSNPNRFVARVSTANPRDIGIELERAVQIKFQELSGKIYEDVCGKKPSNIMGFKEQIKSFWQVYWVMLPGGEGIDSYFKVHSKLEMHLGGVKNLRGFSQLEEEGFRKCSLCGERNALFYAPRLTDGSEKAPEFMSSHAIALNHSRISAGEGLCAVCLVKRFWSASSEEFPLTATVALMPLLDTLSKDDEGAELFSAYKNVLNSCCCTRYQYNMYNDQLLYEDNLTPDYFKKNSLQMGVLKNESGHETIKSAIMGAYSKLQSYIRERQTEKSLTRNNGKEGSGNWSKSSYYALIAFDGDSMGEWLSGTKLNDNMKLEDFHRELSLKLNEFAGSVKEFFIEPSGEQNPDSNRKENGTESSFRGRVVYAGGEDFLGFVTLDDSLKSLDKLRIEFDEKVNQALQQKAFIQENNNLSFSAGMVIAHYKTPLSEALKWVHQMEKAAKEVEGKNSLGIALLKHSGEIEKCVYKWWEESKKIAGKTVIYDFLDIIEAIQKGDFSGRFIKNLNAELYLLAGKRADYLGMDNAYEIIRVEIGRLLERTCNLKRGEGETGEDYKKRKKEAVGQLREVVFHLYQNSNDSLENFISALNIVHFLTREVAGGVD
ncbi:MAG: type III-B CRISPR-associated protein Cas10/Cmr2 [Syntrophomonas sp.]|uniref:type III-B CRISPR-associated protein Cas10/Cmr2 n=1 Tax=Syntrophomonas sp. TaxID=2053627 RepID=UPI00262BE253|nr:type III-B CRISPR-associated protein Cas10/Cmr2 [Syntrophomonas sp.]MDD2510965.1 type III-B CRISPR-associated protein Cas10/Cmr2 [Syntrophomonas sp.]MDD3879181.1 type III-B CRISPR-associated protein Cas10/Cmr2 [Syntrophomonas sp.]MDD4626009.1 type III-B CRISPR-associated protein Cas10/Cmr2 [Syntrophomonas sp.]